MAGSNEHSATSFWLSCRNGYRMETTGATCQRRARERKAALFQSLRLPITSGLTTLTGVPAAYAVIWSKMSENCSSYSSRVT